MRHNSVRVISLLTLLTLLATAGCTLGQGQSKIAGEWYYRDSGGNLEYSFASNGTYTAIKQMTATGYPKIVVRTKGQYTVRGSSIELTPSEVDANGSPGPLISASGRYDEGTRV